MKWSIFSLSFLFLFLEASFASVTDLGCYHNLSANNTSVNVRAVSETQVCKFCHIPHAPQVVDYVQNSQTYPWYEQIYDPPPTSSWRLPLNSHVLTVSSNAAYVGDDSAGIRVSTWTYNYEDGSVAYVDYSPGLGHYLLEIKWQPSGSSKMCFSCHDGTIMIGALITGTTIEMTSIPTPARPGVRLTDGKLRLDEVTPTNTPCVYIPPFISPNPAETNSPWDFSSRHSQDHRVYSSWYTQEVFDDPAGKTLISPATVKQTGALDRYDFVQCTSCHDPHISQVGWLAGGSRQFWRKPNESDGAVCGDCHP